MDEELVRCMIAAEGYAAAALATDEDQDMLLEMMLDVAQQPYLPPNAVLQAEFNFFLLTYRYSFDVRPMLNVYHAISAHVKRAPYYTLLLRRG